MFREMAGVAPSGLQYCLDGMLPMLFFTTRTPMEAGPRPTTTGAHWPKNRRLRCGAAIGAAKL